MISYVADFETTGRENYERDGEVRVWLWHCRKLFFPDDAEWGTDIESFIDYISHANSMVYFHNLSFDGHFLLWYFFRRGYTWSSNPKKPREFKFNIDSKGVWHGGIVVHKVYKKSKIITIFRDSLKKIPASVEEIARTYSLELSKGSICHERYRPINYSPTPDEVEYCATDTAIIAEVLSAFIKQGAKGASITADVYKDLKSYIPEKRFKSYFPCLSFTEDSFIDPAYMGGYNYIRPEYLGKILSDVTSWDKRSAYASILRNYRLPVGEGRRYFGAPPKTPGLFIHSMTADVKLKPGYLPTLKLKNDFRHGADYITEGEVIFMTLAEPDYRTLFNYYDVTNISHHGGYLYEAVGGLFTPFVDKWYDIKEHADNPIIRQIAKDYLTHCYGFFGTSKTRTNLTPVYSSDTITWQQTPAKGAKVGYKPLAIFVTAYLRQAIINDAQRIKDHYIAAMTDSIKTLSSGKLPTGDKIGEYKTEWTAKRFKINRPNVYVAEDVVTRISGMSRAKAKEITDVDELDGEHDAGFIAHKVKGGVLLEPKTVYLTSQD